MVQVKYVDTHNQIADLQTKGPLTRDKSERRLRQFIVMKDLPRTCYGSTPKRSTWDVRERERTS